MMHIPGAWLNAEWDQGNTTFDIGDLANTSARIVWASAFPVRRHMRIFFETVYSITVSLIPC